MLLNSRAAVHAVESTLRTKQEKSCVQLLFIARMKLKPWKPSTFSDGLAGVPGAVLIIRSVKSPGIAYMQWSTCAHLTMLAPSSENL